MKTTNQNGTRNGQDFRPQNMFEGSDNHSDCLSTLITVPFLVAIVSVIIKLLV